MGKTRTVLVEPGAINQQRILLQQPLGSWNATYYPTFETSVHAVTHATGSCSKTAQPSHTAANTVVFLKNQNVHLRRGLQTDPTSIQWIMLCVWGGGSAAARLSSTPV